MIERHRFGHVVVNCDYADCLNYIRMDTDSESQIHKTLADNGWIEVKDGDNTLTYCKESCHIDGTKEDTDYKRYGEQERQNDRERKERSSGRSNDCKE